MKAREEEWARKNERAIYIRKVYIKIKNEKAEKLCKSYKIMYTALSNENAGPDTVGHIARNSYNKKRLHIHILHIL